MPRYLVLVLLLAGSVHAQTAESLRNPLIDFDGFAASVAEVRKVREQRRVTEVEFAGDRDRGAVRAIQALSTRAA